jgi:hypothetical protein
MEKKNRLYENEKISKVDAEFIKNLRRSAEEDRDSRTEWEDKLVIAANQRLGIKRVTNNPYPGAPNIPLPETDKQIVKKKANFVISVVGNDKMANIDFGPTVQQVDANGLDIKRKAEKGFNYILKNKSGWPKSVVIGVDNALEKGHCIFHVCESVQVDTAIETIHLDDLDPVSVEAFFDSPKSDKRLIIADMLKLDIENEDDNETVDDILDQLSKDNRVVKYERTIYSFFPKVSVIQPENIFVPPYTQDLETAERVTIRDYVTERVLVSRAIEGTYDKKKVDEIVETRKSRSTKSGTDNVVSDQKDSNEGIDTANDELFEIWQIMCWRDTGKEGRYERWIFTVVKDESDDTLATIQSVKFPYAIDGWNLVKHDNELKDNRYYSSRGIPERIQAANEFMERSLNNILIRDELNNSPVFTVLNSSKIRPSSNRLKPGQVLRVARHDEIAELGNRQPRVDLSSNMIVDKLKAFIEEYLASNDQLFRNATNSGGGKTLGEINVGVALNQNVLALDVYLFNETLKKLYSMLWQILRSGIWEPFNVDGEVIDRSVFQFDAIVTPTGSIEALDRGGRINRALMRVNMIAQQVQMGLIADADDLYAAMEDYLIQDGVKSVDRYITRPEEIAAKQQQIMMQQQQLLAQEEARISGEIAAKQKQVEGIPQDQVQQ